MTHHADSTEILHTILENIAYKEESNDVTLFVVYPLTDTPRIQQPIPLLYKNHLMGLFLELNLLFPHRRKLQLRGGIEKWNELVFDKGYSFNQSKIKGKKRIELSVKPVNGEQVKRRKQLTDAEKSYLNKLQKKYITHCDHQDSAPDDNDVNPITMKKTLTDTTTNTDLSSDSLETIPNLSNKRMRTHHVGTSGFKICAPSHVHIESVYVHKQGKTQLSEYEREKIAMRERIKVLEAIIDDRNVLNQKLTVLRCNAQKLNDEMARKSIDLAKSISASLSTQSALDVITAKLSKTEQRVSMLEEQVKVDDEKVKIGTMILNLPTLAKKWKGTWNARRYYSLAYMTIPGCSAKYLQMAIPMLIAAFFHDIDIAKYYKDEDLRFIANLTPCDKMLDECVYLIGNTFFIEYLLTLRKEQWAT